jgi:hypothetical protein
MAVAPLVISLLAAFVVMTSGADAARAQAATRGA